jgi:L-alanine-DL-glutamate epimerase-like enolase superfamily enzyme
MEIHVHLAAAYPGDSWVEHFDWLEPLFEEQPVISGGRVQVPGRPGLGLTLSEQARAWTTDRVRIDAPAALEHPAPRRGAP